MPAPDGRDSPRRRTRRELLGLLGAGSCLVAGTSRATAGSTIDCGIGHLNGHAAAFARAWSETLVFGGATASEVRADLWRLAGGRWRLVGRGGPPPRTFPAMAFDTRRERLVVFGGNRVLFGTGGDTLLDDTWEWDGAAWTRGPAGPPARSEAAAAFDESRGTLLLFGGWRFERGERVRLGDLWEWDGSRWTELHVEGPSARSGAAMAFDPMARRTILIGGNGGRRDAWSLARSEWRRLPDLSIGRYNAAVAHDRAMGALVVFGGWDGRQRVSATTWFDGERWWPHTGTEPSPRNHSALVESAAPKGLLLLGGHTGDEVLGDAWRWNRGWEELVRAAPRARVRNGH